MARRGNGLMLLSGAGLVLSSTSAAAAAAASSPYAEAEDFLRTLGAVLSLGFLGCVIVGFIFLAVLTVLIDRRDRLVQSVLSKFMLSAQRRGEGGGTSNER